MKKTLLVDLIVFLFVLLFVYAAVNKLLDYNRFVVQVGQSPLLTRYATVVAWFIPAIEIGIAVLLTWPRFRTLGLYTAFTLMAMFTVYIIIILNFSEHVPCSCGGVLETLGWKEHLLFNIVFVVLGAAGVLLAASAKGDAVKRHIPKLAACLCIALVSMFGLFSFMPQKQNYQHASFLRNVVDSALTQLHTLALGHHGYYVAGFTDHTLYLGHATLPRLLVTLNHALTDTTHTFIKIPRLRYQASLLTVDSPRFALADGAIPYLYTGTLDNLLAQPVLDSIYFIHARPLSANSFALVAMNARENTLEKYTAGNRYPEIFTGLLQKQGEGIFSTDGMLHYNEREGRLLYLYFYRNEYLYLDTSFNLVRKGHTLDTVSVAKIQVGETGNNIYTLAAPPLLVNKRSCLQGRYLFNNSNLLAGNDNIEQFEAKNIIDVYDVEANAYVFSFYIPAYKNTPLSSFTVTGNGLLVALYQQHLVTYRLNRVKDLHDFIAQ